MKRVWTLFLTLLGFMFLLSFETKANEPEENSKTVNEAAEKQVTLYSTYGYQKDQNWIIPIRARVFETFDFASRGVAKAARKVIEKKAGRVNLSEEEKRRYKYRALGFLADNESNEVVKIRFNDDPQNKVFTLKNKQNESLTDRNGNIESEIQLSFNHAAQILKAQSSENGWLSFTVVSEEQYGRGKVRLIAPEGLSVISDIDDTVKVTNIPQGDAVVLNNTFFKSFEASPGMVKRYQSYGDAVAFHYISGSPWQLYQPLSEFLFSETTGFPSGSIHMKNVRTNPFESESYRDVGRLLGNGSKNVTFKQKVYQVSQLLKRFPKRQFILIGDSGELDPEIYRKIKQQYPKQIKAIYIRDLINAGKCNKPRLAGMQVIQVENADKLPCVELSSVSHLE